jgi:heme oxygenase (biliverdin-IX-beta and delta-forming)
MDSLLFERLHHATRLAHQRLERRVDSYRPNFAVDNYRRLLQDFWGFYQPLERKLVVLANHNLPSTYSHYSRQWCKARRLEQDLLSLGMTQADIVALPLCGRLPAIPTLPRVLGVLYVIDGAALGERATTYLAGDKLGISPSQGGSFFSSLSLSYDPLVNSYWQEFIVMTEAVEEPDFQDLAIQSAMDTLECFETWLDYRQQSHLTNSMRTNSMRWNPQWSPNCSVLNA